MQDWKDVRQHSPAVGVPECMARRELRFNELRDADSRCLKSIGPSGRTTTGLAQ